MSSNTIAFLIGVIAGFTIGPLAIFGVAFYFANRDRRAEVSLRDHRTVDDKVKSAALRERSQIVGPF